MLSWYVGSDTRWRVLVTVVELRRRWRSARSCRCAAVAERLMGGDAEPSCDTTGDVDTVTDVVLCRGLRTICAALAVRRRRLSKRSRPLDVAGRSVRRMDDTDMVAHLLLHHFTHYFDWRLKWLVDLERIVETSGFDWERVGRRISEWNAVSAVGFSLIHLERLQPGLIPERLRRLLPAAAWRKLLTLPLRSSHPLDLFRATRKRNVQLYLAAVMLEQPWSLPGWILHRATREGRRSEHPLDRPGGETT